MKRITKILFFSTIGILTFLVLTRPYRSSAESIIDTSSKLLAGDFTRSVTVGDLKRRYRVHVPAKYDATKPTPVIIVFRRHMHAVATLEITHGNAACEITGE